MGVNLNKAWLHLPSRYLFLAIISLRVAASGGLPGPPCGSGPGPAGGGCGPPGPPGPCSPGPAADGGGAPVGPGGPAAKGPGGGTGVKPCSSADIVECCAVVQNRVHENCVLTSQPGETLFKVSRNSVRKNVLNNFCFQQRKYYLSPHLAQQTHTFQFKKCKRRRKSSV